MFKKFNKILIILLVGSLFFAVQAIWAEEWQAPTANPPGGNIDEPINRGDKLQDKTGALHLKHTVNSLELSGQDPGLIFGLYAGGAGNYIRITRPSTLPNGSYTLTLPEGLPSSEKIGRAHV